MTRFFCRISFVLAMIFAMTSSASLDLDLSGKWGFWILDSEDGASSSVLNFIETPFKTNSGQPLYIVEGGFGDAERIWGASVETINEKHYLVWYGHTGYYDDAAHFDSEQNMILENSSTEISLGGDFEEYEVAKMYKM